VTVEQVASANQEVGVFVYRCLIDLLHLGNQGCLIVVNTVARGLPGQLNICVEYEFHALLYTQTA
jgi:hypothetical protein